MTAASPAKPKLAYVPPPPVGPRRTKPSPMTLPPPPVGMPSPKLRLVPALVPALEVLVVQDAQASSRPTLEIPRVTTLEPSRNRRPWLRLGSTLGTVVSLLLAVGIASSTTSALPAERAPAPQAVRMATGLRASLVTLVSAWASLGTLAAVAQPEPSPAEVRGTLPNDGLLALAAVDPTAAVDPPAAVDPSLGSSPPRRRDARRARHRTHVSLASAEVEAKSAEASAPAVERSSSQRRRPVSAAALLHDGEVALALGDAEWAYQLAKRSRDTDPGEEASSLVARSACMIGKRDEAKQALRDLPLFERGAVRRECRRNGGRIGL